MKLENALGKVEISRSYRYKAEHGVFIFQRTCPSIPEQYCVLEKITGLTAHVRFCHGVLVVQYPTCIGAIIYEYDFNDPQMEEFQCEEQRLRYLCIVAGELDKKIEEKLEESYEGFEETIEKLDLLSEKLKEEEQALDISVTLFLRTFCNDDNTYVQIFDDWNTNKMTVYLKERVGALLSHPEQHQGLLNRKVQSIDVGHDYSLMILVRKEK